jgi:chromosome segregation ATPase
MSKHKKHDEAIEESQKALEGYRADIDALKAKAVHYSAEAKAEFDKRLAEMETLYGEMQSRYGSLKDKTEETWEDAKAFALLTNKALVHSYHYFISHYRKKGE